MARIWALVNGSSKASVAAATERPNIQAPNPSSTDPRYCIFDEPSGQYLYTEKWVTLLIEKMSSEDEYKSLFKEVKSSQDKVNVIAVEDDTEAQS